ncbi:hypothetical protein J6590_034826 [Homalodisca vitripennis]|nr:hypothetical protein J6590_034826 [Homalodisca vitripennis]
MSELTKTFHPHPRSLKTEGHMTGSIRQMSATVRASRTLKTSSQPFSLFPRSFSQETSHLPAICHTQFAVVKHKPTVVIEQRQTSAVVDTVGPMDNGKEVIKIATTASLSTSCAQNYKRLRIGFYFPPHNVMSLNNSLLSHVLRSRSCAPRSRRRRPRCRGFQQSSTVRSVR